jgi:hypothetical protein
LNLGAFFPEKTAKPALAEGTLFHVALPVSFLSQGALLEVLAEEDQELSHHRC